MRRREFATTTGSMLTWTLVARAQQPAKVYRIAVLHPASPISDMSTEGTSRFRAFFEELGRLGYGEGRNLVVARLSAEGDAGRLSALARQAVELKPDAILAISNRTVETLKAATTRIPIVSIVADPVGLDFAASLARPGGNITGFAIDTGRELVQKHIELLREVVPTASRLAILGPSGTGGSRMAAYYREAIEASGIATVDALVDPPADESEYRLAVTAAVRERVDALYVTAAPENFVRRRIIAALAAETRLPAIYVAREHVEAGGLLAYGIDFVDIYRRLASCMDQVLKGANPAGIPFQQPVKFELVINLKTARTLGLTLPHALLARADEVIE